MVFNIFLFFFFFWFCIEKIVVEGDIEYLRGDSSITDESNPRTFTVKGPIYYYPTRTCQGSNQ